MVTLKIKAGLSIYLISAAALFARNSYAAEQKLATASVGEITMEHRSYSIGAVIASSTFLEAAINELYLEAIDQNQEMFGGHKRLAELMGHLWETIEEKSTLAKYQIALTLAENPPFPKNEEPYQAVAALIQLRNALIHYKPEWDTELDVHRNLEEKLSKRFAHNPHEPNTKSFFPHRCLGHGCAEWAVQTAMGFYVIFMKRIDLPLRDMSSAGLATR